LIVGKTFEKFCHVRSQLHKKAATGVKFMCVHTGRQAVSPGFNRQKNRTARPVLKGLCTLTHPRRRLCCKVSKNRFTMRLRLIFCLF